MHSNRPPMDEPPRTPRGTRFDRLGLDGDEIVDAAEARADVAKEVAKNEWYLGNGAEGRTRLEALRIEYLASQKMFIAQIEEQGGYCYASASPIQDLIEANQMIEALSILLQR